MARLPQLFDYASTHSLKIISIADLIQYRLQSERFVVREAIAQLPTELVTFKFTATGIRLIHLKRSQLLKEIHVYLLNNHASQNSL